MPIHLIHFQLLNKRDGRRILPPLFYSQQIAVTLHKNSFTESPSDYYSYDLHIASSASLRICDNLSKTTSELDLNAHLEQELLSQRP